MDELSLKKIFQVSGIESIRNHMMKILLKEIVTELYNEGKYEILWIKPHNLKVSILKCRDACNQRYVRNVKSYMKACILSSIKECALRFDDLPF